MIDFTKLTGIEHDGKVVTQIEDSNGGVIWAVPGSDTVIMTVEKITSQTYAGGTTYTNESFIRLLVYPKTNGTVRISYGGITKTITDTSGEATPNGQAVTFGTFNGVSDEIETPTRGALRIDGDYRAFASSSFAYSKSANKYCDCIVSVDSFGTLDSIGANTFRDCLRLEKMVIPASVVSIDKGAFYSRSIGVTYGKAGTFLTIDEENPVYSCRGSCIIEKANGRVLTGFADSVIPQGVKIVGEEAFSYLAFSNENIVIPDGVTTIEKNAFSDAVGPNAITVPASVNTVYEGAFFCNSNQAMTLYMKPTTPPNVPGYSGSSHVLFNANNLNKNQIVVPKGCASAYKSATGWKSFDNYIVEE